jgi:hypothetical protein
MRITFSGRCPPRGFQIIERVRQTIKNFIRFVVAQRDDLHHFVGAKRLSASKEFLRA